MKKTLYPAWLVLMAMLVPAMLHAEDANVEEEPKLSLEASLSGDDANPVLTVRLTNIGEVPVIVDKELVFMLSICPMRTEDKKRIPAFEPVDFIRFPEVSEVESRLSFLNPGEKMERLVRLREGYENFFVLFDTTPDDPDMGPKPLFQCSGALDRISKRSGQTEVIVTYNTSHFFVDYVVENVENVDAVQLYRDKIHLSVAVPYEFTGETYSDPKTE